MKHYVYIVECDDGSFYTGYTLNVEKRVFEHNSSPKGAKSLRGRLPVKLVYTETHKTKSQALKRELEIKNWSRIRKEKLVSSKPAPVLSEFTNERKPGA